MCMHACACSPQLVRNIGPDAVLCWLRLRPFLNDFIDEPELCCLLCRLEIVPVQGLRCRHSAKLNMPFLSKFVCFQHTKIREQLVLLCCKQGKKCAPMTSTGCPVCLAYRSYSRLLRRCISSACILMSLACPCTCPGIAIHYVQPRSDVTVKCPSAKEHPCPEGMVICKEAGSYREAPGRLMEHHPGVWQGAPLPLLTRGQQQGRHGGGLPHAQRADGVPDVLRAAAEGSC